MISHENEVMILLGATTVILLVSMNTFTDLPTWITIAVVIVVGVLIPQFITRKGK
jgi:ABC-type xylose transport system permease subunit